MKYAVIMQLIQWLLKEYGDDAAKAFIKVAREWAQDDGKVDWDDSLVDILEWMMGYLLEKYAK